MRLVRHYVINYAEMPHWWAKPSASNKFNTWACGLFTCTACCFAAQNLPKNSQTLGNVPLFTKGGKEREEKKEKRKNEKEKQRYI